MMLRFDCLHYCRHHAAAISYDAAAAPRHYAAITPAFIFRFSPLRQPLRRYYFDFHFAFAFSPMIFAFAFRQRHYFQLIISPASPPRHFRHDTPHYAAHLMPPFFDILMLLFCRRYFAIAT